MLYQNKSKILIFIFGLAIGFAILFYTSNGPCYNTASIYSFFTSKFEPCNAYTLSKETRDDATFALIPSATTVKVGQTFYVSLIVDPQGIQINAVGAEITNSTNVRLLGNDESMSPFLLNLNVMLHSTDTRNVMQGQPNPGFTTSSTIARFAFVAISPGTTTISIGTSSLILANDGFGTNVLRSSRSATITILP